MAGWPDKRVWRRELKVDDQMIRDMRRLTCRFDRLRVIHIFLMLRRGCRFSAFVDSAERASNVAECAYASELDLSVAGLLVRSVILSGSAEKIRAAGKRPFDIARQAGLPSASLRDPDLLVSMRSVMSFFDLAATACKRRTWGAELGADVRLAAVIGPLWVLLRQARTVKELCRDLARNYDLYTNAALMSFELTKGGGLLGWSAATGFHRSEVQIAEYALAVLLNETRAHAPAGWTPDAVYFRHEAPSDLRVHRRIFGLNLRFRSGFNAIEIGSDVLSRPLRGAAPGPRALTQRVLRLRDDSLRSAMSSQVEALLRALLPYAPCGMREVSEALGVPPRTLQARLREEESSLRMIKESIRQDLAKQYLNYSGVPITQIAELLGYSDPSSFSRTFRRWHGLSVRVARKRSVSR